MDRTLAAYYDDLAPRYDEDRFGNSYGRFLDGQERRILDRYLPASGRVLDLACGTGRLSDGATHGCDISMHSLRVAAGKHAGKTFLCADATALPFGPASFDAALSFHLFMHLNHTALRLVLAEVARILRPGGVFVADVASALRRRLGRRRPSGWHGGTSLSGRELAALAAGVGLRTTAKAGVMMLPVHRLPSSLRAMTAGLDRSLAALAPELASYLVLRFVRDPQP